MESDDTGNARNRFRKPDVVPGKDFKIILSLQAGLYLLLLKNGCTLYNFFIMISYRKLVDWRKNVEKSTK